MRRVCTSCSGAFRRWGVGEAASRSMCTDPECGGELAGATVGAVGLDGLGGRSRLWLLASALGTATLATSFGLRFRDSERPLRCWPSRLWVSASAVAFAPLATRLGLQLHGAAYPFWFWFSRHCRPIEGLVSRCLSSVAIRPRWGFSVCGACDKTYQCQAKRLGAPFRHSGADVLAVPAQIIEGLLLRWQLTLSEKMMFILGR